MDDIVLAIKEIILNSWEFNNFKYYQITGQEISIIKLAENIQSICNTKENFFNFGGLPYREGEIMKPQYIFDELPFLGRRKIDIYESLKKEIEK